MLLPLAIANYRGVGSGLNVSTTFTIAKLVPLGLFVVAGLGVLLSRGLPSPMHLGEAAGTGRMAAGDSRAGVRVWRFRGRAAPTR